MDQLSRYNNVNKGRDFLIVGAGASLKDYARPIRTFILNKNLVIIGINKMTEFVIPDYHLWTNNQRLRDQIDCIDTRSKLMLGVGITKNLKTLIEALGNNYILINYISKLHLKYKYINGIINGHFRTAGILAIAIANILGANKIHIVGADGFCFHTEKNLKENKGNQHCYGTGFTDDATYEQCRVKDKLVHKGMVSLKEAGISFKIITPTVFTEFFEDVISICK